MAAAGNVESFEVHLDGKEEVTVRIKLSAIQVPYGVSQALLRSIEEKRDGDLKYVLTRNEDGQPEVSLEILQDGSGFFHVQHSKFAVKQAIDIEQVSKVRREILHGIAPIIAADREEMEKRMQAKDDQIELAKQSIAQLEKEKQNLQIQLVGIQKLISLASNDLESKTD